MECVLWFYKGPFYRLRVYYGPGKWTQNITKNGPTFKKQYQVKLWNHRSTISNDIYASCAYNPTKIHTNISKHVETADVHINLASVSHSLLCSDPGIDEDDLTTDEAVTAPTEDMPPLEGDDDDTSRMEEVD